MSYDTTVHAKAIHLVRAVVEMTTAAASGHPSSAASLAHLVTVLLYDHLRHDVARPDHPEADRLMLSEGHACPIVYAAAADLGIAIIDDGEQRPMQVSDAMQLRAIGSEIDGHPNPAEGFPFFPAATGSLGQGLSIAAGMAIAARLDGIDKRVFCLIGDGESREGQIWEALDFIVENDLRAVLPIFNCNAYGQTEMVSPQQAPAALQRKLEAFGFEALMIDGHHPFEIRRSLDQHVERQAETGGRPLALVAKTVKGWGMPVLQGDGNHGKPLDGEHAKHALRELTEASLRLNANWGEGVLKIPPIARRRRSDPVLVSRARVPLLSEALRRLDRDALPPAAEMSPRKAFGIAIRMLGHARPDIVVLDCDVGNSTYTDEWNQDIDLRSRFVQCRIAEQNMVSCAAGLCAAGKTPIAATFGKFLSRGYDQLEMALVSGFALKVVGSHIGISAASDGPSQMALPDAGYFRTLSLVDARGGGPLVYVLTPSDAHAAYALTLATAEHPGAVYLRTMRSDVPFLYHENAAFPLGGHRVLAEGDDLLIASWGYMVHKALAARDALAARGISAGVVDLYSIPFDTAAFVQLARENGGRILTVEDNYGGGIGSAVCEALLLEEAPMPLEQMYVRSIPKSGRSPDDVLRYLGLSVDHIEVAAQRLARAGSSQPAR